MIRTQNLAQILKGGFDVAIYDKVREACAEKKISVSFLEEKLGFSRGSIYKWDNNIPSVQKVKAVSDELEKSIEYFLEE